MLSFYSHFRSSSTIPKKLFEKAEFVSSNDPDVDQNNLVYIESDSEESEKFNYDMHLQETALQEVVGSAAKDNKDEITDNPIHVTIKKEEELIIEDEPIQICLDDSCDSWKSFDTEAGLAEKLNVTIKEEETEELSLQVGITRIDQPVGMITPPYVPDYSNIDEDKDEEQFMLITDTPPDAEAAQKTDDENTAMDTSLMDHQYSQQETTNKEFCFDLVQNLLKDSGNETNPTAIPLLSKFTELVECFVEDHDREQNDSQMFLYLTNMKKTLNGMKIPGAKENEPQELEQTTDVHSRTSSTLCPMTQEDGTQASSQATTVDENINIPETELDDETKSQEEIILKKEPGPLEKADNVVDEDPEVIQKDENVNELKIEITKVKDFAMKLMGNAYDLMNLPMETEESSVDIKNKLKALLKTSRKEFRSLIQEINGLVVAETDDINEKTKKNLIAKLGIETSDFTSSDSDSEGDQILNLKRKIPKNKPHTPAIVSSTKEDSDAMESGVVKQAGSSRSQSSGSETEEGVKKKKDLSKTLEKLLDFTTLNCPKPVSSKKASKQKKLKKKKTRRSSDIDSFPSSSDDNDSLADSSSSSVRIL